MVALDTNSLVSFYLKRKPHFSHVAKYFLACEKGLIRIYLPLPVFLETEWVLRSIYKQQKSEIIDFFHELMLLEGLTGKDKDIIKNAVSLFETKNISFTDAIILSEILTQDIDEFQTFDEKLEKIYLQEKV